MLKTLIFDLGRVIVPFDFRIGYKLLANHCTYTPEEIPERIRTLNLVARFESGLIEPRDFVNQLSEHLSLGCTYQQFEEIWTSIFSRQTLLPEAFFESLHQHYRLVLLSNTNAIHFDMVEKSYPLLRHFDELVLSYRVGALKPQPEIFQAAIAAAHCEPEECFFTDDILEYVTAAKTHGIDAVQFQNRPQLESDLRARGVIWE